MNMPRIVPALLATVLLSLLLIGGEVCFAASEPLLARSDMMTVDELRPGMKGVGKSVFKGTKVESFGVTVIGVLRKVDFDGDIILVRIDSGPPVIQGFGVAQGMSGSPIYVNGKLIGALAYAWSFAKTPIAGVTPITQMLEAYEPGSSPVRLGGTLRAAEPFTVDGVPVERGVVLPPGTTRTARPGVATLTPISTPVIVTGLSPRLMEALREAMEPLGLVPLAGGG
ncbi:MAG: SpoIVB peptidase S55, partial [Armatimonadetes bacterium]|nr:SpoIVB peptidase S55 [Armatimonadota bacterium]